MDTQRLFQIYLLLLPGEQVTAVQLAQATGASERTVYRDLQRLAQVGLQVHGAAGVAAAAAPLGGRNARAGCRGVCRAGFGRCGDRASLRIIARQGARDRAAEKPREVWAQDIGCFGTTVLR